MLGRIYHQKENLENGSRRLKKENEALIKINAKDVNIPQFPLPPLLQRTTTLKIACQIVLYKNFCGRKAHKKITRPFRKSNIQGSKKKWALGFFIDLYMLKFIKPTSKVTTKDERCFHASIGKSKVFSYGNKEYHPMKKENLNNRG